MCFFLLLTPPFDEQSFYFVLIRYVYQPFLYGLSLLLDCFILIPPYPEDIVPLSSDFLIFKVLFFIFTFNPHENYIYLWCKIEN